MRFWTILLALLSVSLHAAAQEERDSLRYKIEVQEDGDTLIYFVPDIHTWHPEDVTIDYHSVKPLVSMTSIAEGQRKERPGKVVVILPNNTLEMWGRVNVSNGQAQNWGSFPDSYLDARTLSFPPPRR